MNLRQELEETIVKLNNMHSLKSSNLLSTEGTKIMKVLEKQRAGCAKKLKRLEQIRLNQVKFRRNEKLKMKRLIDKHPDVAKEYKLVLHDYSGQPRIEDNGQGALCGS